MGGKVAMFHAVKYPDKLSKLIVVDIAPRSYPVHHQHILDAMGSVDLSAVASRGEVEEQLEPHLPDWGVRQFIMKNLNREDDNTFSWKLNLAAIRDNIENVGMAVEASEPVNKPTLFVRGEKSDYIRSEDEALIHQIFPEAHIVTIKDAGHWVHAEQPKALYETLIQFLQPS
jgi:pimeloyl-ACP methyl ester carboxylesterase